MTKAFKPNIDGKVFKIISNMYELTKSCIRVDKGNSQFFLCNVRVRRGENLSPILFSIFLNDLTE